MEMTGPTRKRARTRASAAECVPGLTAHRAGVMMRTLRSALKDLRDCAVTMTVSNDDDDGDAQQIEHDAKIALALQVEENIGFATAHRKEVSVSNEALFEEESFATAEALLREQEQYGASSLCAKEPVEKDFGDISSSVAGISSLDVADGGGEEEFSDESFFLVSEKPSDSSSAVLV